MKRLRSSGTVELKADRSQHQQGKDHDPGPKRTQIGGKSGAVGRSGHVRIS